MKESSLLKRARVALSALGAVLFRNNVGSGWLGDAKPGKDSGFGVRAVVIYNARRVKFGLFNGSSDLIGWHTVTVTPEMVGRKLAVFTAVETKSLRGVAQRDQRNFLERVEEAGGIAVLARSVEEATQKMQGGICHLTSQQSAAPHSRT